MAIFYRKGQDQQAYIFYGISSPNLIWLQSPLQDCMGGSIWLTILASGTSTWCPTAPSCSTVVFFCTTASCSTAASSPTTVLVETMVEMRKKLWWKLRKRACWKLARNCGGNYGGNYYITCSQSSYENRLSPYLIQWASAMSKWWSKV